MMINLEKVMMNTIAPAYVLIAFGQVVQSLINIASKTEIVKTVKLQKAILTTFCVVRDVFLKANLNP